VYDVRNNNIDKIVAQETEQPESVSCVTMQLSFDDLVSAIQVRATVVASSDISNDTKQPHTSGPSN
jgi:hypothetical protein